MATVIYVDNGTELITDLTQGFVGGGPTASGFYMGWGTGGSGTLGTATNTDVDLRVPATESRVSTTGESQSAADTVQWIGTLTAVGTAKTIEEFGLFIDATGTASDMLIRANHGGVALATEDAIEYTASLQQT